MSRPLPKMHSASKVLAQNTNYKIGPLAREGTLDAYLSGRDGRNGGGEAGAALCQPARRPLLIAEGEEYSGSGRDMLGLCERTSLANAGSSSTDGTSTMRGDPPRRFTQVISRSRSIPSAQPGTSPPRVGSLTNQMSPLIIFQRIVRKFIFITIFMMILGYQKKKRKKHAKDYQNIILFLLQQKRQKLLLRKCLKKIKLSHQTL